MQDELKVLQEVTARLEKAGIAYMVTGSVAANFYAVPRMTRDIDLVVEAGPADADTLFALFREDFYADPMLIREAIRRQRMFNIIHNETVLKIDLIIRKESEYRKTEFKRRRQLTVEGHPVWVVAPEDLILSKLDWARDSSTEIQFRDVENLLSAAKGLDMGYLNGWIGRLDLRQTYERVKR
jgi:hypothetical protein